MRCTSAVSELTAPIMSRCSCASPAAERGEPQHSIAASRLVLSVAAVGKHCGRQVIDGLHSAFASTP